MSAKKEIPCKSILLELYNNDMSLLQIGEKFNASRTTVAKWFRLYNIDINVRGGGNNRKVCDNITKDFLEECIKKKYTNKQIADSLKCCVGTVNKHLKYFNIKRCYKMSDFQIYNLKVRRLTEKTYIKWKHEINPNGHVRTLCGITGGYQLDHIISVRECFDIGASIEECASKNNIQIITWEDNLGKRKFGCNVG